MNTLSIARLSYCVFGGLLLVGTPAAGLAQTSAPAARLGPPFPFTRFQPLLHGRSAASDPVSKASDGRDDSSDLMITNEPSAIISIFELGVEADFTAGGDTVIRSEDSDACVARLNAYAPDSPAGQMTVNSASLPSPLIVNPDPSYFGAVGAPPFVFPIGERQEVTIETTGSSVNPAIPLTRLHSADESFIQVLTPVIPSSGPLLVDSTKPLEFAWQAPPGHHEKAEHNKLIASLWFIAGPSLVGEVRCGFDLAKGHGTMPASLLHAIKTRIDPANPIPGAALRVLVGDRREVRDGGVSYVIELGVLSVPTTNIPVDLLTTVE